MDELQLSPPWRDALKRLLDGGLTYGHTVSKDEIARLLDLKQPVTAEDGKEFDLAMLRGVTCIRESLLRNQMMYLRSMRDGSYLVVMPQDQTGFAVDSGVQDISRALKKMALGLAYTNTDLLTDEGRRENVDAQAKVAKLATIFQQEAPALGWQKPLSDEGGA